MTKLPSFQFYPGDWMKDPALAICSHAARGIWIDVLCLMFESPQRGYLITNHQPWTLDQIARAVRGDVNENLMYLEELVKNGVMKQVGKSARTSRRQSALVHAFYSARMVQDDVNRTVWKSQKRRQRVQNKQSLSTPLSSPSSSSSSSSKTKTKTPLPPAQKAGGTFQHVFWGGECILVTLGRRRRIPSLESFHGARAQDVVEFLSGRGFPAEIVKA